MDNPTPIDLSDFTLEQGSYGIALVTGSPGYQDFTDGVNPYQLSPDLSLTAGSASNDPSGSTVFHSRCVD